LLPYLGPLFLRTCVYPLGLLLAASASRSVFEPQAVPEDYVRRAAILLVLRPKTFYCNARDLALLQGFIAAQVPRYVDLRTPTVIITGDCDTLVSPQLNAQALAAILPSAKLVLLKNIGHMPHHAAPDVVAAAVEELVPRAA
jgi:pimeloyl-ACP methyl ester carboxylesterase